MSQQRRILVVDDDSDLRMALGVVLQSKLDWIHLQRVRELVRINLEFEGYTVREAGSAEDGLAAIDAARPDLILLDVMMPQVDGWEMLRRVQERHGVGSIPVVMFSGKADEQSQVQATSSGAQAFVGKPFDLQQLIDQTKQIAPV